MTQNFYYDQQGNIIRSVSSNVAAPDTGPFVEVPYDYKMNEWRWNFETSQLEKI
jgi:hypothetical protein